MSPADIRVPSEAPSVASRVVAILSQPWVTAILALALVITLGLVFHANGAFYKWSTHRDALRLISVYAILACGMTVVILAAGIDLSVGSVLGLIAVAFSILVVRWGWSAWAAIPACLLLGACCGAASGSLIAWFRIQPFIVTLAMMVFARGLAKKISHGEKIWSAQTPEIFTRIDSQLWGGNISVVTLVFFACLVVCWIGLTRLRWGRYVYAIGGNEEAARLSGVPVSATKIGVYALAGLFSAVAGICYAAQETQGDPEAGATYELTAIAIVVIGGTSLMGGRGGVGLTLLGTLIIGYVDKILSINAVPEANRLMLTGAIIVVAVLIQRRKS